MELPSTLLARFRYCRLGFFGHLSILWPVGSSARAWGRCASVEMHSDFGALRAQCSMNCGIRVRLNEISPALKRDIDRISELWNEGVTRFGGPFLAGETFTAVNAFFAPVAFRIQTYSLMLDEVLTSYAKRLLALPSMQSWYNDALVEPWRESDHEAEAKQAGTLIEDLRTAVS